MGLYTKKSTPLSWKYGKRGQHLQTSWAGALSEISRFFYPYICMMDNRIINKNKQVADSLSVSRPCLHEFQLQIIYH